MPVATTTSRLADLHDRPPSSSISGSSLWLEFVNTDAAAQLKRGDLLRDFESLVSWLHQIGLLDDERAAGIRRRALLQPAAAAATVVDARRVRSALRVLAERGHQSPRVCDEAAVEVNRVLGRSAGTRRIDRQDDGEFAGPLSPPAMRLPPS